MSGRSSVPALFAAAIMSPAACSRRSTASAPAISKIENARARAASTAKCKEVILALSATVDGQTTAHYVAERLQGVTTISGLAQGMPIGGELDYMDDGTISAALRARRPV